MSELLDIDGSILEGGGQILRISVSLSAILGVPVRVCNIRAARKKPGLAAQHLKGIELVANMCQAKLRGAHLGSTEIEFIPGKIKGGHYMADPKTAGSISLLLQVALPCALMADRPVTLNLKGGTNADMAPQIDFMDTVFKYMLRKFNADFNLTIHKRGYYPKGGGHVTVEVTPIHKFLPVNLTEPGQVENISGKCFVAGCLPTKMAHQMADGIKQQLRSLDHDIYIDSYKEDRFVAPDSCNGAILSCHLSSGCVLGSDCLGKRSLDPFVLGTKTAEELQKAIALGVCVDQHVQDQIILYMALAEGVSFVKVGDVTLHTKTAIAICELIAKTKFEIEEKGNLNLIRCSGIGFTNKNLPPE